MLRASAALLQLTNIYHSNQRLTPSHEPFAYFLELDEISILLDCGWDYEFSLEYLEKLLPYAEQADVVLISSPQLNGCGALPFVLQHLKPSALVFAASSTAKIGLHGLLHPFMYNFPNKKSFEIGGKVFELSIDSIYGAFRSIREPFGGKVVIPAKNSPVECFTHFASRMVGGYAWTIKYQIDEILYCPDYSVKPSYSLKLFTMPTTPNILLMESFSAERREGASKKQKNDEQLQLLFKEIQKTFRSGNDVLMPVNVAGRGIEILIIIMNLLREKGADQYKVLFASIQAEELLKKVEAMTEVLQDKVILNDQSLFSSVIPCRNAEEVHAQVGPKLCVADGAVLNFGIAGDLLSTFLECNPDGGKNLIVFTESPPADTVASKVFSSSENEIIEYELIRRSYLNREELEEHYIKLEREIEERRQALNEKNLVAVQEAIQNDELEEAYDDGELGEAALPDAGKKETGKEEQRSSSYKGLYTSQPIIMGKTKFLQFAVLPTPLVLFPPQAKENLQYGIPISEEEELMMKALGSSTWINDAGPAGPKLTNDAQAEANAPSKIVRETMKVKREASIFFLDLSGHPDMGSIKALLKGNFSSARKHVCIRGSFDSYQAIANYCRSEKTLKCSENVYFSSNDVPVKLDTPIFSYTVKLHSSLEQQLPRILKRVRDTKMTSGGWEMGWVDGCLTTTSVKRAKTTEESPLDDDVGRSDLTLTAVSEEQREECAASRRTDQVDRGSFFVGDLDLQKARDSMRRECYSDFHQNTPLLVYEDGVAVRRSGNGAVTIASIPTETFFKVRKNVYNQFFQVL